MKTLTYINLAIAAVVAACCCYQVLFTGTTGAAKVANPGIQSLQKPAVPKNSLTCLGVVRVGI